MILGAIESTLHGVDEITRGQVLTTASHVNKTVVDSPAVKNLPSTAEHESLGDVCGREPPPEFLVVATRRIQNDREPFQMLIQVVGSITTSWFHHHGKKPRLPRLERLTQSRQERQIATADRAVR